MASGLITSWQIGGETVTDYFSGIPVSFRMFQFVVIHTVKGFGKVNKAEVDFFWYSLAFSMIQRMLAICLF